MQPVLNIEDIKRVEVELTRVGVSVSELMHRAGYAAAQEVLELEGAKSVAVLCGMGNNGGDGWVAAEALLARGLKVQAVCPMDRTRSPATSRARWPRLPSRRACP